ncbi:MAG TPA: methylmalonyl Co-A mutase-associated GTPase MeaB [Bryobacteraceae bacterium]|nr:methylmalonyl Co-A mutase-associated GTPase MeaB [Bryobacteraceae bacterium]
MAFVTSHSDLADGVIAGDTRSLARAATLIESQTAAARQLIAGLFSRTGHATIVGITGPPGSGKSTLVDGLAKLVRKQGRSVGIIAVDPSSPYTHGAILGDRIRMQDHHDDPGVFIRSMATRGRLGGLAQATLDMALLLDAAGRDVVFVETVGVGQDEVEIASLADVTVVVLVPGLGDDVQAIKAGIMEVADVFAINKSDLPGAERLEQEIRAMQSLGSDAQRDNAAPIRRVIAAESTGLEDLMEVVETVFEKRQRKGARTETWVIRLRELLRDSLMSSLSEEGLESHAQRVAMKLEDPYTAVDTLRNVIIHGH